jgi:uncharacterized protein (DUF2236 family)
MTSIERHRAQVRERLRSARVIRPGPESVSWKINREVVVVAAWGRAILLQLAHPLIAAGVHDHSSFRGSLRASYRRFQSTVGAMLSVTFGDAEQVISTGARINWIHDRVHGRAPEDAGGEKYSAHDPDLQRWVHSTLLSSVVLVYERLVARLTDHERDSYCLEAAIMEPLLGVRPGRLPRGFVELDTYMRDMVAGDTIVITETSRELARAVLYPPHWYLAWPVFRPTQLLTIGLLPPSIREAYGFRWSARDERALARWTVVLRTSVRILPPLAREWPAARRKVSTPVTTAPAPLGDTP